VLEAVEATPGAIGYVSLARVEGGVRALAIEGFQPTLAALGDYPLAYSLYLAASAEPAGEARTFIQWILGPQGRGEVTRCLGAAP
jgi:ABC-type phosphate transport system substrate-binding protein